MPLNGLCQLHFFFVAGLSRGLFYALVFLPPVNRSTTNSLRLSWSAIRSCCICFLMYSLMRFLPTVPYPRNNLVPRNADFRTCTLNSHVCRKSSGCFSLANPHHIRNAILGRKTYQHVDVVGTCLRFDGLDSFLFTQLLEYLSLYPFWFGHTSPFCGTLAQTLHNIDILHVVWLKLSTSLLFLILKTTLLFFEYGWHPPHLILQGIVLLSMAKAVSIPSAELVVFCA